MGAGRRSSSSSGPRVTRRSRGSPSSRRSGTLHIELYRGFTSGYDVNAAGAYAIGGKPPPGIPRGGFFIACTNYGNPVTKGTVPKPSVTITERDGAQVHPAGIARY